MRLKGIIDNGVLLVLWAVHANPDAVDFLDVVVLASVVLISTKLLSPSLYHKVLWIGTLQACIDYK